MKLNLTPKLAFVFVLFAASVLVGVNTLGFRKGQDALTATTTTELDAIAGEKEAALQGWILERQASVEALANSPNIREELTTYLKFGPAAKLAHEQLSLELAAHTGPGQSFLNLFIVSAEDGRVLVSVDPGEMGKSKADRPYFIEGKKTAYTTPIYYSPDLQAPAMTTVAPLFWMDGKLLGVLVGRLDVGELNAIIQRRSGLRETDDAFLVNASGLAVTRPRFLSDPAVLQQDINSVPVNLCLQKKNGTVFANDYQNIPVVVSYRWLPEQEMCLIVKISQAEALAPILDFLDNMIWIVLAVLVVASIVALALSRTIVRPILSMQTAVQRYSRGDLDIRLPETRGDELGVLAHEFNVMASALFEKETQLRAHSLELEKRVAERTAELRHSEEQFRLVVQSAPSAIIVSDMAGTITMLNTTAEALFGYSANALMGQKIKALILGQFHATHEERFQEFLTEPQPVPVGLKPTLYALHKDGHQIPVEIGLSPYTSSDGLRILAMINNIAERQQAELQLADALEFTERILTSAPIGIFTYQLSGKCLSANAAAAQMVGATVEQLKSQNFRELASWKQSGLYDMAERAIASKKLVAGDVHVLTTFGKEAWYRAQFVTFKAGGEELLLMIFADISERKFAEAALEASERRFRTWIENSSDIITVIDAHGAIQYESPSLKRLLDYEPDELLGKNAFDFVHPEDQDRINAIFGENIQELNSTVSAEFRFRHKDGSWRFLEGIGRSYKDEHNEVVGLIHSRDVTERKQAEEAVTSMQKRFQALIENAPDGIALLGLDGKLRQVTPSTQQILGYTIEESTGQDPALLTHPDDLPELLTLLSELIQNPGKVSRMEYRFRHKDGSWRWLESTISNLISEPGVQAIVFNYRDIADRKLAETAVRESEDRYRDLVEHIRDLIGTHDLQGNILSINPAATELLGFDMDTLLSMNMRDLLAPEIRSGFADYLTAIQRDGYASGLMLLQLKNGERRIWEYDNTLRTDSAGGPVVRALARDVTERKQAEKALKEKERLLSEAQRIGHIGSWSYSILSDTLTFSDEMYRLLDVQPEEFHHNLEDFLALVYPSDRPMAARWFADMKEAIQAKDLDFRLFHKNGELCYLHCTGAVEFDSAAKPARFIGTAQDVTQRRAAEIQIDQHIKRLTALSEIDRAIISSFDQHYTLSVILSHMISLLQVDAADILLLDSEKSVLTYTASQGFRTKLAENTYVRVGESHAGRAAKERRMIRIPDLRETTNIMEFNAFVRAEGFVSYIAVPLIVKGDVKGVLEVYQRSTLQPYQDWLDFLNTLVGQTAIAIENTTLFENLRETNEGLIQAYDATIEGWSRAMDLRDRETEGHTQRVTKVTLDLARAIGIDEARLIHIRRGALLHDIGKLGVPDHILFKPGNLTNEEREIIEKHVDFAYEMLAPIQYLKPALNIPYFHHEKWDGTGYPLGLKGEQIPLEARIFALVDVWDALLSDRPYRQAWTRAQTIEYIRAQNGSHFDPRVVECFLELIQRAA